MKENVNLQKLILILNGIKMKISKMTWGYYGEIFRRYAITTPIKLSIKDYCMTLITGASGSGKSYAMLFLLGSLIQSVNDIVIYICDFKNSEDFIFLSNYERYYSGDSCYDGIMQYYSLFTEARKNENLNQRYLLICDEYPSLVNYLITKDRQNKTHFSSDLISAISQILMLGRGIGFGIWIITQRADSSLFTNGARDNFMVIIGLGRLSKEQKSMIFTGEDLPERVYRKREGVLLADGHEIVEVKYPKIKDLDYWKSQIRAHINKF